MDKYVIFSRIFWSVFLILYVMVLVTMIYLAGKYLIIPILELIGNNMYAQIAIVSIIAAIIFRFISKDEDKYTV